MPVHMAHNMSWALEYTLALIQGVVLQDVGCWPRKLVVHDDLYTSRVDENK